MKARYKTIVDSYAQAIHRGQLAAGTRLPTHRTLAAAERISLATATRVYRELEAMGLVSGETGRGTFVRDITLPPGHGVDQQALAGMLSISTSTILRCRRRGCAARGAQATGDGGDIDAHLRYQPHAGRLSEREIIARYLTDNRFAPDAENVLIVNGAQHGLAVTVMGLLCPGDVVAVDALTYSGFKALAALYHLELAAILPRGRAGSAGASRAVPAAARTGGVYHADAAQSAGLGAQRPPAAGAGGSRAPARPADY